MTFPPIPFIDNDILLSPFDYSAASVTRACAKTHLGNTCRRDWLGKPDITCISTCEEDFCNCDTRSPPLGMFENGKPLALAPKDSVYFQKDLKSCNRNSKKKSKTVKSRGKIRMKSVSRNAAPLNAVDNYNVLFLLLIPLIS